MGVYIYSCENCEKADTNRQNRERIRCTRFSKWVHPNDEVCEEYRDRVFSELFKDLPPMSKLKEEL